MYIIKMADSKQQSGICIHQCNDQYHKDMEPVVEELLKLFWDHNANFKDHVYCINKHMKTFKENGQVRVIQAVKILGLNFLCCHHGDRLKKELKLTDLDDYSETVPDRYLCKCFLESLKCYSDIKNNKLGSAEELLKDLGQETICADDVPCESTAFYWRTMGSYNLHNAWTATEKSDHYKKSAKESFQRCLNHFQRLSKNNPWCQYLVLLYVKAMATTICLQLKMCWFLFDPLSIEKRFARHVPTETGIIEAWRRLSVISQEMKNIVKGSIWEHHLRYQLLLINLFYHCRVAQYMCSAQEDLLHLNFSSDDIITMSKDLKENYSNGTNSQILENLSSLADHWHRKLKEMRTPNEVLLKSYAFSKIIHEPLDSGHTTGLSELDFSSSCNSDSQPEGRL